MKRILLISFMLCSALIGEVLAQDRTVTGKVTSAEDGTELPGVNVLLKGTSKGVTTDVDGNYKISVPSEGGILQFSFIGLASEEVNIGSRAVIDVKMLADVKQLGEVIVTGQGVGVEKKRLSTTVDVISSEQIKAVPAMQLDQLLQAQLPNAQIRLSSGQPGTASMIRSRGPVSANASTTPIIYIDGVRVDNLNSNPELSLDTGGANSSAIADIPLESIERIEYVKGGAATTLYGADAANGVIQIFTKRGSAGKAKVNFETQQGAMVGTEDYLRFKETADILFRPGHMQNYRLGVEGGNDKTTYSFSGSIYGDQGFRIGNDQVRRNLRTTVSSKVNDKLRYTGSAGYSNLEFQRDYNANTAWSSFTNLETIGDYGFLDEKSKEEIADLKKLIHEIVENTDISEKVNRFQNSHTFELALNPKISMRANLGMDFRSSRQQEITTNKQRIIRGDVPSGTSDRGYIEQAQRDFFSVTGDFNAQYRESLGEFSFITSVGGQFFRNQDKQLLITATNVTEGSKSINNSAERNVEDFLSTVTNYGFYLQENLGFKDKLFLEFGMRMDGNSAFGSEIGLQAFPKVGAAYSLSDESFFKNAISSEIVSQIKFRANYGEAGNFPTPFTRDRLIAVNAYLGSPSYTFGIPGDVTLRPERTATTEIGTDLGFFSNRLKFELTYYNALTKDALFNAPFASSYGQVNQLRNIGTISNKGFELAATVFIIDNDDISLRWNGSINTVDNLVVSSGGSPEFNVGGFTFLGAFVKEGQPLGYLRGSNPTFDAEGNLTEVEQNAALGSPIATMFGTTSLNFTFKKRLNLYVTGDYQRGASGVAVDDVLRYFAGAPDEGRIPENSMSESFFDLAGVWMEKTDYFKVRNISVSYNVPSRFTGNFVKNMEVGFNVTNPLNFVSSRFDPEVTGSGIRAQGKFGSGGFGYGTESAPRIYLGTVRFSL